jgi:hypothetical protein
MHIAYRHTTFLEAVQYPVMGAVPINRTFDREQVLTPHQQKIHNRKRSSYIYLRPQRCYSVNW